MTAMIDPSLPRDPEAVPAPRFEVGFARTSEEVLESQRLRHRIFAGELGARIDGGEDGVDRDRFDPWCRHLLVRDTLTREVIACTRILTDDQAPDAGGFYSAGEFDLAMIDSLPGRFTLTECDEAGAEAASLPASRTRSRSARSTVSMGSRVMEIGRTCVDARYRNGAVIATLWQGIAAHVTTNGFDYLFGCASISLEDGGAQAHAILQQIRAKHLSAEYQRVRPYYPLPAVDGKLAEKVKMPPLLKAYLSLGAKACGEAHWDRDFDCADVFMLLDVGHLHPRYARHFLADRAAAEPVGAGHA